MKIYLAARYGRHPQMREYAAILEQHGHTVTSRWIKGNHHLRVEGNVQITNAIFAIEDVEDILISDYLLCFNDERNLPLNEIPSKGGMHAEFGMAIIKDYISSFNTRVGLIGERTHIFHWLPFVEVYPSFEEFVNHND